MKNLIVCLLVLMAVPAFSQKKGKVDPKDQRIDSLTQVTAHMAKQIDSLNKSGMVMTKKIDSLSKEEKKYHDVYKVMKDKVVKYNFDPARTSVIIDSLKTHRESSFSELTAASTALSDSITTLNAENAKLEAAMNTIIAAESDKEKIVSELKQLKELLDVKIITQAEYDEKKVKLLDKWQ